MPSVDSSKRGLKGEGAEADSMAGSDSQESLKVGQGLMLIGGQWVGSSEGQFIPVENPSRRGNIVGEVPRAKEEDVDRAVS